ncbi:hypothetical protein PR048_029980 [Dryococelus australis]|uniref:HAT C-terminal dimerisation domain-containing protein n=1 Tax=Dryococelus australis TaxID=614101 RepID=A0ABQ9GAE6_9NEOP|nr:hypothetical protein PR048_029980 [Dryococelus australis]
MSPKQLSVVSAIDWGQSSKENKQEFILDFTNMLLGANIPLEKVDDDSVCTWLQKYISGADDIPTTGILGEIYLPKIGEASCDQVKRAVENQKVVVLADQTTDKKLLCIFIILICILTSASGNCLFVGGVTELDNANGTECSRASLSVLAKHDIKHKQKGLEEGPNVDVCQVLQGLKNDHANFVSQVLAILRIPPSNMDCERGFSAYGHIFSDLCPG